MFTRSLETALPVAVSEHEEQVWILQQQNPDRVSRHVRAWRLSKSVDISLIKKALVDVVERMPDLNVRFHFSDEGDLQKFRISEAEYCFDILEVQPNDLMSKLCALRESPWDASLHPPFMAWVLRVKEDKLLVFVSHPILDRTYHQEGILNELQDCYFKLAGNEHALIVTEVQIQTLSHNDQATYSSGEYRMSVEQIGGIILDEFRLALGDPGITLNDDFFDHGGHSLVATRIIGKLASTYGIEISFDDFFRSPTAESLAACAIVSLRNGTQEPFQHVENHADLAPLTLAQAFLWRAYAGCGFSSIFNLPFVLNFLDAVDEDILFESFNDILKRHPALRTTFHVQNGEVQQRIVPESELFRYKWFWTASESEGVKLGEEASYLFDLSLELPIRVRFIRDSEYGHQILSFLVHHMVIDEWSLNTMMKELAQAYVARGAGKAPVWEVHAQSISNFALLQKKQGINQEHVDYWTRMLRDATKGLRLGASDDRSPLTSGDETYKAQWLELVPEQGTYERILAIAKDRKSSIFGVVYTAIAIALYKLGSLKELVIGTSASGRTDPEFFDTVGYFTTMVAHRVQFFSNQSVADLIRDVSRMVNDSIPYADVPIDIIQNEIGMAPEDGLFFDVYVQIHANNALNGSLVGADGSEIRYRQVLPDKVESLFGLHFEIMEDVFDGKRELRIVLTYRLSRYSTTQAREILALINRVFEIFGYAGSIGRNLDDFFLGRNSISNRLLKYPIPGQIQRS